MNYIQQKTDYENRIQNRSFVKYFFGLLSRIKSNIKYELARKMARRNGAHIGEGVVMPISLAKKLNSNCSIGNHVSIQTDDIDTRAKIVINDHVIIGSNVKILTASHNIDSLEWEYRVYGITIESYVWIATNSLILPSCRRIKKGAVIGAGSVVARDVDDMSIVSGNPAIEIRKRKQVHANLVVESLLGGDLYVYKKTWKNKDLVMIKK